MVVHATMLLLKRSWFSTISLPSSLFQTFMQNTTQEGNLFHWRGSITPGSWIQDLNIRLGPLAERLGPLAERQMFSSHDYVFVGHSVNYKNILDRKAYTEIISSSKRNIVLLFQEESAILQLLTLPFSKVAGANVNKIFGKKSVVTNQSVDKENQNRGNRFFNQKAFMILHTKTNEAPESV